MGAQDSKIDYRSLFDNMLDGLAYCKMFYDDKNRPIDYINLEVSKNFESLTGLKNVVGKKITKVIPNIKKTNPELFEVYGRVALTGKTERFETYVKLLDRWFLISVYSDKKHYFTVVFQNITKQKILAKKLEDAKIAAFNVYTDLNKEKNKLDEAKAKEDAIFNSIADGIIVVDKDNKIILFNKATEKLLDYDSKKLLNKSWFKILQCEDNKGGKILPANNPITTALSKGTVSTVNDYFYIRKDKKKFPVSQTVSPVILKDKIIGAVNVFRDITKEKEMDRVKNEFVSLASHQLRTPLTGIAWTIEIFLKKEKLSKKGKEYLKDIIFSVRRSSELVKTLLNTSRIETGSVGVNPVPLDVVDIINKVIEENKLLCKKKKISIIYKCPKELKAISDLNLLKYTINNLFNNAIDYNIVGGEVEIILVKKEDHFLLTIKDTGIGIPSKEKSRIFEKFMRASNAITNKPDGTGLGLYIAHRGTRLLGGKIWFESKENKGTTFFLELPLKSLAKKGRKGKGIVSAL